MYTIRFWKVYSSSQTAPVWFEFQQEKRLGSRWDFHSKCISSVLHVITTTVSLYPITCQIWSSTVYTVQIHAP